MAFRMVTELDLQQRHSPQIKSKGIHKRKWTLLATNLAKKVSTPVWPFNADIEASSIYEPC